MLEHDLPARARAGAGARALVSPTPDFGPVGAEKSWWEMHGTDASDRDALLVRCTSLAGRVATSDAKPLLLGDIGSTLKSTTMLAISTG